MKRGKINPGNTYHIDIKKKLMPYLVTGLILAAIMVFGYMQLGWFNTPVYLISVTAEDGAIIGTQDAQGCFELTFKGADHLIWFTDRPERDALSTHITVLVDNWPEVFENDPPNADLQLFNTDGPDTTVVIKLDSTPVWNENTETLKFDKACPIQLERIDEDRAADVDLTNIAGNTFPKAVLFIDDLLIKGIKYLGKTLKNEPKKIATTKWTLDGSSVSKLMHDSITTLINLVDPDNSIRASAINAVAAAADTGGDVGESIGGSKGRQVGSSVGAQIGMHVVKASSEALLREDISKGSSLVTPDSLYAAIHDSTTTFVENYEIAFLLAETVLTNQSSNIASVTFNFINAINDTATSMPNGTYVGADFCGVSVKEFEDVFLEIVLYYLRIDLEQRILFDLNAGMSISEIQSDVSNNLASDLKLVIEYSIWKLQDVCLSDVITNKYDLYQLTFYNLFIANLIDYNGNGLRDVTETGTDLVDTGLLGWTYIDEAGIERFPEIADIYAAQGASKMTLKRFLDPHVALESELPNRMTISLSEDDLFMDFDFVMDDLINKNVGSDGLEDAIRSNVIRELDLDGDGTLQTAAENSLVDALEAKLAYADVNGDGTLNANEIDNIDTTGYDTITLSKIRDLQGGTDAESLELSNTINANVGDIISSETGRPLITSEDLISLEAYDLANADISESTSYDPLTLETAPGYSTPENIDSFYQNFGRDPDPLGSVSPESTEIFNLITSANEDLNPTGSIFTNIDGAEQAFQSFIESELIEDLLNYESVGKIGLESEYGTLFNTEFIDELTDQAIIDLAEESVESGAE